MQRNYHKTFSDIPHDLSLFKKNVKIGKIVHQIQVRDTLEKTYAIDIDMQKNFKEIVDSNSGDAYMQFFMQCGFLDLFQ
ncbi:MAG: hypothetical protein HFI78_12710 [Lachnospiraceae bacterium]|jgi:hypothetical protein|nr:hypothetical protein [Lachnospiraceae bacterium]